MFQCSNVPVHLPRSSVDSESVSEAEPVSCPLCPLCPPQLAAGRQEAMTCFSGCFSSLPGLRCDRSDQVRPPARSRLTSLRPAGSTVWRVKAPWWQQTSSSSPTYTPIPWSVVSSFLTLEYFVRLTVFTIQIGLDVLALFCKKKSYGSRINNKLYCSQISKQFLLKKYPLFPEKVEFPLKVRLLHDVPCKGNCGAKS